MRPRLYLDEDVPPELARLLRAHGHDVISTHERGLLGSSDEAQLVYASAEGRALLTFNYGDFLRLGRTWWDAARGHAGIILSYRQYRRRETGELARIVARLLDQVDAESLRNTVLVLEQFRTPLE